MASRRAACTCQFLHDLIQAEARGLLARRELLEGGQEVADVGLGRHQQVGPVEQPVVVGVGGDLSALVGVAAQVEDERHAQRHEGLGPGAEGAGGLLLQEDQLPVVVAQRGEVAVVGEVEDLVARALVGLAGEQRQDVVAVQVDLVVAPDGLDAALLQFRP
jgi:hypothetical protein